MALGIVPLLLVSSREARADGCGACGVAIPGVFLVGAGAAVVSFGVDTYWSVRLVSSPTHLGEDSAKWAVYWTAWQPAVLYPVSLLAERNRDEAAEILQATATWPLGISAAGLAMTYPERPAVRNLGFVAVGAADAVLLAHDGARLVAGERVGEAYAYFETIAGALQLTYATSAALSVDSSERPLVLGLSAVPLTLVAHGVLSLALPEKHEPYARRTLEEPLWFAAEPISKGMMVTARGRF
jgi:hypothetical protein